MARTPAQRGPFGRWLKEAREARYERQADALEAMRRLAGLHISPSELAQWESGSRVPRPDNPKVERLYEFFGSRPQEETGTVLADSAGLTYLAAELSAAIRAQTEVLLDAITARDEAIERLLRELAEYRTAAIRQQVVEQSLIEALPVALATALAATREDDPVDAPLATVPQ